MQIIRLLNQPEVIHLVIVDQDLLQLQRITTELPVSTRVLHRAAAQAEGVPIPDPVLQEAAQVILHQVLPDLLIPGHHPVHQDRAILQEVAITDHLDPAVTPLVQVGLPVQATLHQDQVLLRGAGQAAVLHREEDKHVFTEYR